jgi:predicted ATPase/predicted Ser/Thr protein kinase
MMASQLIGSRFRIDDLEHDLLGRGGMGAVYRGTDTHTGDLVAVKALDPHVVARDPELLERFTREGEALRQLNHPNIVRMIAAVEEQGHHYLVMEYVPGGSLRDLLEKEGRLQVQRSIEITLDLADALTRAHRLGILHRDLKPENVLLAADGTPRLADFGLARLAASPGNRGPRLTQSGMLMGTVDYVSPEACQGEAPDERSDIWSFGVMLFEMLTGRVPFGGDTLMTRLNAILTQRVPDLLQLAPGLPDAMADLVYRMLEKDRQQRIPSVRQVGLELEALQKGRPVPMAGSSGAAQGRFASATPTTPPPGRPAPRHNLPLQMTPFLGREAELVEVRRLVDDPAVRLVTVVGLGGMGKTRLALEAAEAQVAGRRFGEGVWLVRLAPVQTAAGVVPAVAQALGFALRDGTDSLDQILDHLRDKQMLLFLDNFEHLLAGPELDGRDGARPVTAILEAAPRVKILATSRLRLNVPGEQLFHLAGMDLPDGEMPTDPLQSSVVKLFLQSARRVRPGFELAAGDVRHVAAICRAVGGMPLGVLLAAAWVEMLSPAEIAAEMQRSPDLLDSAGREGSIHAVFDYSWGQLTPAEREVFGGLSAFRGGFTREAGQEVTGAGLRELLGLVNKSLLSRAASNRYELHELLRQYAAEKLDQSGRAESVGRRHLEYYLALAEQFEREQSGPGQADWMQRLAAEIENVRAALAWSIAAGCPQAGLRLTLCLLWFWRSSSYSREGRDWLERLLAEVPQPSADRVEALRRLANFAEDAGDNTHGIALREQALAAAEALGDPAAIAEMGSSLALKLFGHGDAGRAQELVERSLALCQDRSEMQERAAFDVMLMGELAYSEGNPTRAQKLHEHALGTYRDLDRPKRAAWALMDIGIQACMKGDLVRARQLHEESVAMWRCLDDRLFLGVELSNLGSVLVDLGELERGRALLVESLSILVDMRSGVADWPLLDFGMLAHAQGQHVRAVRLLGAADALRRPSGRGIAADERGENDRALASLRAQLGETAFAAAWREGQALSLQEATALAMSDEP